MYNNKNSNNNIACLRSEVSVCEILRVSELVSDFKALWTHTWCYNSKNLLFLVYQPQDSKMLFMFSTGLSVELFTSPVCFSSPKLPYKVNNVTVG